MLDLITLIDLICSRGFTPSPEVEGWEVQQISGGRNNLLFRAARDGHAYAIKFTRADALTPRQ